MRIVILGPFGFHPNKTMRSRALPLARALSQRGHKTRLIMPPWQTPLEAGRRWREDSVDIVYVKLEGDILGITNRMIAETRRFQPDVVHNFKPKAYSGLAMWWLWYRRRISGWLPGSRLALITDTDDWEGWGGGMMPPLTPLYKNFFSPGRSDGV